MRKIKKSACFLRALFSLLLKIKNFYSIHMINLFETLLILRTPNIGPVKYNELLKQFGSVVDAAASLKSSNELCDSVLREIETAQRLGITFISDKDSFYPKALLNVKNHPPVLSVRGNIETLARTAVAMVGTRHATASGMDFVARMANGFVEHGIAVVSGMAMGTDTAAHRGALAANGVCNTIAVLAGGVDVIWPLENERLYYEIIERGAIVSEMPIGMNPVANNFVMRNRIIAGIGEKLILSEADSKSGSMKTAGFAEKYNREIYAIPSHPADSRSMGPNSMIRSGRATLCMGIDDFFTDTPKKEKNVKNSESEISILDRIGTIPLSESVLAEIVGKNISEIKRDLVVLELQGLIRKQDGGYVRG